MVDKQEVLKLSVYFVAASTASLIRFLKSTKKKTFTLFIIEMLIGASFALFLIPAIVEHWNLSIYIGTGLTWVLTMFSEGVIDKLQNKLNKKIDDVVDSID